MKKLPPLAPPYTGGGCATLGYCGAFLHPFLLFEKGWRRCIEVLWWVLASVSPP